VGQKYYVSVWWCRYDCTTVWLRKKKCFMLVGSTNFAASLVRRITWSDHVNNKDMFYCSDRIRFGLQLKIQIRSDPTMFCILAIEWSWVIFIVYWKKNTLPCFASKAFTMQNFNLFYYYYYYMLSNYGCGIVYVITYLY
jgi:hypothetical protein